MVSKPHKFCVCVLSRCDSSGSGNQQVSGINGDVRRALELLRLAIDVYHDDQDESKGQQIMVRYITALIELNPLTCWINLGCFEMTDSISGFKKENNVDDCIQRGPLLRTTHVVVLLFGDVPNPTWMKENKQCTPATSTFFVYPDAPCADCFRTDVSNTSEAAGE